MMHQQYSLYSAVDDGVILNGRSGGYSQSASLLDSVNLAGTVKISGRTV